MANLWRISIPEFLVSALKAFFAAVRERVFILKTADSHISAEVLGVLVPVPHRLACSIIDLHFFPIIRKMGLGQVLAHVLFQREQEVDWVRGYLEDLFFLNFSCMEEFFWL